jgi:hypothetical protein
MAPTTEIVALARTIASAHGLDPALVCAVVEQESAWDADAIRYEPAFRARYVPPLELPPTEEIARSISWGLMQVMGQVARYAIRQQVLRLIASCLRLSWPPRAATCRAAWLSGTVAAIQITRRRCWRAYLLTDDALQTTRMNR